MWQAHQYGWDPCSACGTLSTARPQSGRRPLAFPRAAGQISSAARPTAANQTQRRIEGAASSIQEEQERDQAAASVSRRPLAFRPISRGGRKQSPAGSKIKCIKPTSATPDFSVEGLQRLFFPHSAVGWKTRGVEAGRHAMPRRPPGLKQRPSQSLWSGCRLVCRRGSRGRRRVVYLKA
jgi:hypothetical protein